MIYNTSGNFVPAGHSEDFKYIGLFTADPRRFRVPIFRNGTLYWQEPVVHLEVVRNL